MEKQKSKTNQLNSYPFKQLTFQVFFQKKTKEELVTLFNAVDDNFYNWVSKQHGSIESYPLFEYYKLITSSIYHFGDAPKTWEEYYPLILPQNEVQ